MRIVGGKYKGVRLSPPPNLPVRPTTDMAKEALFNILQHKLSFPDARVLDLFSGTGNISFEFISRGTTQLTLVEQNNKCVRFIQSTLKKWALNEVNVVQDDVFAFLKKYNGQFDVIFADPPYDLGQLTQIPGLVMERGLLAEDGLLIVEHPTMRKMPSIPEVSEVRTYGYSSFSFYQRESIDRDTQSADL